MEEVQFFRAVSQRTDVVVPVVRNGGRDPDEWHDAGFICSRGHCAGRSAAVPEWSCQEP